MGDITLYGYGKCMEGCFCGALMEWRDTQMATSFASELEFIGAMAKQIDKTRPSLTNLPKNWIAHLNLELRRYKEWDRMFFQIDILYLQHSTWQGRLVFGERRYTFRSQEELIIKMKTGYARSHCLKTSAQAVI